jgi:hypothetical protein
MTQLPFKLSELKFDFDLKNTIFEIDAIQDQLIQFYLQTDMRFRRAYSIDFTRHFFKMISDKARLKQPIQISTSGNMRGGKSESMMTVSAIHMALYGKIFTPEYICGNNIEFLEKIKEMPDEKIKNSIFQIDEEKQSMYSLGSYAKKTHFADFQNITAISNVSTIMICPNKVSNPDAMYSLRVFGKGIHKDKPLLPDGSPNYVTPRITKFMLYNLQGGDKSDSLPLGMVYIPNFQDIFPKEYTKPFMEEYLKTKNSWVQGELKGSDDVLAEMRLKIAKNFSHDETCMELKKSERFSYISVKLGSGYTKSEIEDIVNLTSLLEKGALSDN